MDNVRLNYLVYLYALGYLCYIGSRNIQMKSASISEIKKSLQTKERPDLIQLCLKLAKYKVENKELLSYLLFESDNEQEFIKGIQIDLDEMFEEMNAHNIYYIKKSLRKTLRFLDRVIKYSGIKETEVILRLHFIALIKTHKLPVKSSKVLLNLYERQLIKIKNGIHTLHEDLQYDYLRILESV
jgi:hypothetical protein